MRFAIFLVVFYLRYVDLAIENFTTGPNWQSSDPMHKNVTELCTTNGTVCVTHPIHCLEGSTPCESVAIWTDYVPGLAMLNPNSGYDQDYDNQQWGIFLFGKYHRNSQTAQSVGLLVYSNDTEQGGQLFLCSQSEIEYHSKIVSTTWNFDKNKNVTFRWRYFQDQHASLELDKEELFACSWSVRRVNGEDLIYRLRLTNVKPPKMRTGQQPLLLGDVKITDGLPDTAVVRVAGQQLSLLDRFTSAGSSLKVNLVIVLSIVFWIPIFHC